MDGEEWAADAALFTALRAMWQEVDPMPADLADRLIAAVAVEGLDPAFALLALVESDARSAVRGDGQALTLQFSSGTTSVLVHVTSADEDTRRVDGWVTSPAVEVRLVQGDDELVAVPDENGRFAFDAVPQGIARLRLAMTDDVDVRGFQTPQFEV